MIEDHHGMIFQVDPGESIAEAVVREIREETGITVTFRAIGPAVNMFFVNTYFRLHNFLR